ncbi:ATP-binding protein [Methylobacterium oryzihabitans]|uniref:Histidine kinase n=1 Tax=Methylobacterium oryzihabitans TaxID=2499852 RepID=A0A437NT19_9HYPH|nr:ATP-binding protein [Methylobacterium oryzihabitans]RVU13186.1 histidine kinase [Methylobacterium oryzihabitans]
MIETAPFQARARTVDHLGREQIADTPTAISELWKNSYDAYAKEVSLEIYDGQWPVAALLDDGHGMTKAEFVERWLVIGTESKATGSVVPLDDRNGLPLRPKLGQKGIGRLSCANLGPLLLLVSKRRNAKLVAALLDWRLFENPYLNFADLSIPHIEADSPEEIFPQLNDMADILRTNVTGGADAARAARVAAAWQAVDDLRAAEVEAGHPLPTTLPSKAILDGLSQINFEPRHLSAWGVAKKTSNQGTALLVGNINYDLMVQLPRSVPDGTAKKAQEKFFETLSSFVDPFVDPSKPTILAKNPTFAYVVRAWDGNRSRDIVGSEKQFDRRMLDGLEHMIDGVVDASGIFRGKVKAFGTILPEVVEIAPPADAKISRRPGSTAGTFLLFVASMEFTKAKTTLPAMEYERYEQLAEKYAGFMIFRDGLRVLPYGRTDNDFFEIESRRSKHAGREFWNHRQMFGRIAITREGNPNLKDKAGREGLLDNEAAKSLKSIVENLLRVSARRFFGSDSAIRKEVLPGIESDNKNRKAAEQRAKLRQRQGKQFRSRLRETGKAVPTLLREVSDYVVQLEIRDEVDVVETQRALETYKDRLADLRILGAPKELGPLQNAYMTYREGFQSVQAKLDTIASSLDEAVERISPANPRDLLNKQAARLSNQVRARIISWKKNIEALQKAEFERVSKLASERGKIFQIDIEPVLAKFDRADANYVETSKTLEALRDTHVEDNAQIFAPYVAALENLTESIDLEHLATFGADENMELRSELDRLNALAQLGIAVEIAGHELQAYDDILGAGLRALPDEVRNSRAAQDIAFGFEGLTDQLRILTPLRLAGRKIQRWITGDEIFGYVSDFFRLIMLRNGISLEATDAFRAMRVFDQQSRLVPVFINLINNSAYWLSTAGEDGRRIVLDVAGTEVIVSDNGPGVPKEDVESLFTLFFTRKSAGGRGVGLYLCKSNLAAGGHRIRYVADATAMPLAGANFAIEFRGAVFDGR